MTPSDESDVSRVGEGSTGTGERESQFTDLSGRVTVLIGSQAGVMLDSGQYVYTALMTDKDGRLYIASPPASAHREGGE